MKATVAIASIICFVCNISFAQTPTEDFYQFKDIRAASKGNEYISGGRPGSIYMKVNLWGAVNKSGIHYVPPKTDIIGLLSYAGGPKGQSDLEEVTIRRQIQDQEEILKLNLKEILGGDDRSSYRLEPNDIIMVPTIEPAVSSNTLMTIGFVTSLLTIVMAGFVLSENIKKKP
jgi:hypothetical protein